MDALKALTSKLDTFDGEKNLLQMKFWLIELSLFYIIEDLLKEQAEKFDKMRTNGDISKTVDDRKKDDIFDQDVICHDRILRALSNNVHLFFFCQTETACDIWTALDQRYATAEKDLVRVCVND